MKSSLNDASSRLADRRHMLKIATALAVAACSPRALSARAADKRSLAFVHLHTGETLETTYWLRGKYRAESLHAIDHILRDHRAESSHPIDVELLDLLYQIRRQLRVDEPFQVISGYRTPATNSWLRQRRRGVAVHSFHMYGKAVDLRLASHGLRELRQTALKLRAGGVGYYPGRGFLHLDVGPLRTWVG